MAAARSNPSKGEGTPVIYKAQKRREGGGIFDRYLLGAWTHVCSSCIHYKRSYMVGMPQPEAGKLLTRRRFHIKQFNSFGK